MGFLRLTHDHPNLRVYLYETFDSVSICALNIRKHLIYNYAFKVDKQHNDRDTVPVLYGVQGCRVGWGEGKSVKGRDSHFFSQTVKHYKSEVSYIKEVNVKEKSNVGEKPFYFVLISMGRYM